MRKHAEFACLADSLCHDGVVQLFRFSHRVHCAARNRNNAVIFSEWGRDMETGEAVCGCPHNWVALREDHCATLLNLMVREEGIQTIDTMPEIHDQEFASAFGFGVPVMFHRHIHHMAHATERFRCSDTFSIASRLIVDFARCLDYGG